jgi:L-threonylcarbamoyladenylate synthase
MNWATQVTRATHSFLFMQTAVLRVNPEKPETEAIARAAAVLCRGGLVAFPTETVYGLGAHALDATAVARIFAAKGRPAGNPLIVHVADLDQAQRLAASWPDAAGRLGQRFWPGPLTLVVSRRRQVPDIVTAGGPTVGLRVPAHPVALALLRAAALPIAAPSANISSQLSPTRAEHVLRGLAGKVDLVLDAGPSPGGLESTVVDVTAEPPVLLRPGLITVSELEGLVGPVHDRAEQAASEPSRSPGLLNRHYAPRAALECIENNGQERVKELTLAGLRVGWVFFENGSARGAPGVEMIRLPRDPMSYAAQLYAALHALDAAGVDRIVVELPPRSPEWLAIHDRLRRASTRA